MVNINIKRKRRNSYLRKKVDKHNKKPSQKNLLQMKENLAIII